MHLASINSVEEQKDLEEHIQSIGETCHHVAVVDLYLSQGWERSISGQVALTKLRRGSKFMLQNNIQRIKVQCNISNILNIYYH